MKQLDRFLGCLTYAQYFSYLKIVKNFKKICKNLPVLNLPKERDKSILETDTSNEHWDAVLKIKKEKLYKYCSGNFNEVECNYPTMEKEILAITRGIKKFLIFFARKPFLICTDCKGILGFVKKNLSNMQPQR